MYTYTHTHNEVIPDTAAKLIERTEPKSLGMEHNNSIYSWQIETSFYNWSAQQHFCVSIA